MEFNHEQVIVRRGERSGLPVIVAVHSTKLGPAVGGCRLWTYDDWREGLADALRLSEAMSLKCSAAGLEHGGGKSVIAVPVGATLDTATRADAMRDLGDVVESLGGRYTTGEDVGTGPHDMRTVRERTRWAAEPPATNGGPASEPTSLGVYEAIKATVRHGSGSDRLDGVQVTVIGLGHVGLPLAHRSRPTGLSCCSPTSPPPRSGPRSTSARAGPTPRTRYSPRPTCSRPPRSAAASRRRRSDACGAPRSPG